jgi:hypothetical protein
MEKLIGGDVRYLLSEKLSCKDIWNMSKVTQYESTRIKLMNLIKKRCISEMKNRLKSVLKERYDEFADILERTGVVISGSFIVQCLLNEDWNTDIDIFVPMIGNKIGKTDSNNPTTEIDDLLFQKFHMVQYEAGSRYGHDIHDEKIQWVRTFSNTQLYTRDENGRYTRINYTPREKKGYDFQVILVNVEKERLSDFIMGNFDFDIVKNVFTFPNNLEILKMEEIFNKRTEFKVGDRFGSSVQRAIRYERRGFTFLNKNMSYEKILTIYDNAPKFSGEGMPKIKIRNLMDTDIQKHEGCQEDCIIKFTHPEDKHYHVDGHHPSVEVIIVIPK